MFEKFQSTRVYFPFFTTCIVASSVSWLFKKKESFSLPTKNDKKKTLVLDPCGILVDQKFSLINLGWKFYKRQYAEEFLFNSALLYEIVFITDNPLLNRDVYKSFDPYGCASYNIYINNKKELSLSNINRQSKDLILVAKDSDEYTKELEDNTLILRDNPKDGLLRRSVDYIKSIFSKPTLTTNDDTRLLDLTDFLYSIKESDTRPIIKEFRNKHFFEAYEETRKKMFRMRNFFSNKYEESKQEVNQKRVSLYQNALDKLNDIRDGKL